MSRLLTVIVVSFALLVIAGAFMIAGPGVMERLRRTDFKSSSWIEGSPSDRARLVNDLVDSELLIGLTREQVSALLGPADFPVNEGIGYTIDRGHTFGSTPWMYTLSIRFDETGRVEEAWVHD